MLHNTFKTWLPLTLGVIGSYAFQRGLVLFSKIPGVPGNLLPGLKIYYAIVALSALLIGILCDQINTRKLVLIFTVIGCLGILALPWSAWGFGVLFGTSAALFKLGPYSGPLKTIKERMSWNITPQVAAKSIGSVAFALLLGTLLVQLSWTWAMIILLAFYLGAGVLGYLVMPEDKIEGWKLGQLKTWMKDWKTWLFMGHQGTINIIHQLYLVGSLPALLAVGYSKTEALLIVGVILGLYEVVIRFGTGWFADRTPYWPFMLAYPIVGTIGLLTLTTAPIIGMLLISTVGAMQTGTYWPLAKKIVGPVYLGTFLGIGLVIQYAVTAILF